MSAKATDDPMRGIPEPQRRWLRALVGAAAETGLSLYWVGGTVRDALLGRAVRDIDLAVAGGGMEALQRLAHAVDEPLPKRRENARYRTLSLETQDARLDLAALRSETYDAPGSLPSVSSGTLEQDLLRRDFTINALAVPVDGEAIDSIVERAGRGDLLVIDLVDGVRDLEARTLRVLHPRSFHDDPTRALRAARLAVRLGFKLARSSRTCLRDAVRDGAFGGVSGDRLRREFEKLFEEGERGGEPAAALMRLDDWQVLPALEPGLEFPRSVRPAMRRLGQAFASPPWKPRALRPWVSGLFVWFAALRPALRRRSTARLSVRGELADRIQQFDLVARRAERALARARGRGAVDRVLGAFDEEQLFALHARCSAPVRRRVVRWANEDRDRRLPISGRDLLAEGVEGPTLGLALERVRAAMLDGKLRTRDEALVLAREVARRRRPPRN